MRNYSNVDTDAGILLNFRKLLLKIRNGKAQSRSITFSMMSRSVKKLIDANMSTIAHFVFHPSFSILGYSSLNQILFDQLVYDD